ncbi:MULTISPECIES: NAD(P)H-binding protein [Erwiniaceae]|uniref:NAD(P)H-binding protein n=1 Tax=Erwiniaceae TaxID=1903409 RepID=UPI00301D1941
MVLNTFSAKMLSTGFQRLIALSTDGASETRNASLYICFVRSVISEKMRDKDAMEEMVMTSTTKWTLIRPLMLTNAKASGRYLSGVSMSLGVTGRISRDDLASFILNISINE